MVPWLLIGPSLALALVVIVYPFLEILELSLHDVSPFGLVRGFVGLANYARMLEDPVFLGAALRTLEWTALVVGGTVILSLPVAMVLGEDFHGRGLARTIVLLPWSMSLAMAAIVWLWSFNGDYGMVNAVLKEAGLIARPVQWMARGDTAFPVEVGVGILVSVPFTVTIFLGGLASIPGEIYEAARIDGAGRFAQFRWMTLPLLRPFVTIAVVLNMIYVFNSFPIIWVMTQGGPDNSTQILVTYLYMLAFQIGRPGVAAAVSVAMLAIVFAITLVYLRLEEREAA
ncbi:MAG TPA: sugar ABC transporter permease [Acetobacteraceae bacterium]|jgi:multiple sugar transport system permease protein|nr:sugar ABC transporter permease [Acetobacteraceae bacterium]